jgi:hypothetical protein
MCEQCHAFSRIYLFFICFSLFSMHLFMLSSPIFHSSSPFPHHISPYFSHSLLLESLSHQSISSRTPLPFFPSSSSSKSIPLHISFFTKWDPKRERERERERERMRMGFAFESVGLVCLNPFSCKSLCQFCFGQLKSMINHSKPILLPILFFTKRERVRVRENVYGIWLLDMWVLFAFVNFHVNFVLVGWNLL